MAFDSSRFDAGRLSRFWDFVTERQNVWHRRFALKEKPPWTDDPIIGKNRFTNVYRRLDPGTVYAESIIKTPASRQDRLFNLLLYRLIGKKETHAALGFQQVASFSPEHLMETLRAIAERGDAPFTGAYMVSGYAQMGGADKPENVARLFADIQRIMPRISERLLSARTMEDAFGVLRSIPGFGDFLAYQVLVDATYDVDGKRLLDIDPESWAKAGPGAKRGIRILVPDAKTADELDIMKALRDMQVKLLVPRKFPFKGDGSPEPLSLSDIQNCLCEYRKYVKIGEGTGRGRRAYP